MPSRTTWVLLAAGLAVHAAAGCSSSETLLLAEETRAASLGSVWLALSLGDASIDTLTAVLSGERGFETQTRSIDVQADQAMVSVFFGDLPVGAGYTLVLSAGACSGSAGFAVKADWITLIELELACAAGLAVTGRAEVAGSIEAGAADSACDLIHSLVATPSVQSGAGPSRLEVSLTDAVTPTSVSWSLSSTSPRVGILQASPSSDREMSFDCATNGTVEVVASVRAVSDGRACSEEAHAVIECVDQDSDGSGGATPELAACAECAFDYCGAQLAEVSSQLAAVGPILNCVLGENWQTGVRASATSCANLDLLGCYCGSVPGYACADLAPASLDGPCGAEVLAGTGCSDSSCVQAAFLNTTNASGKAMQYLRCQQDYCYDHCFNP